MPTRKWRVEKRTRATGTFWRLVTGRVNSRVLVSLGAVTQAEAEAALARMQRLEDEGQIQRWMGWHAEEPDEAVKALVADVDVLEALDPKPDYASMALEDYIDEVFAPWREKDRPRGWGQERRVLDLVKRDLGRYRLGEIDAHLVADYLDSLVCTRGPRAGQPAAGNTKRLRRAAIQAVLHRAYRLRHIPSEPKLAEFEIRDSTKTVLPKSDPLTLEELVRLMKASPPRLRAMWAVGAGQGLRPSELVRLTWADVDFEARTLSIPPDETGAGKTADSVATIPLTPFTLHELREWWMRCGRPREGLMFPSRRGGPYQPQGFRKSLETAAEKAGINRKVHPYLLRHSFATIAWSLGIDIDTTRRMMRHVDETMLQRVYQRPRPADLAKRVEAFAVGRH